MPQRRFESQLSLLYRIALILWLGSVQQAGCGSSQHPHSDDAHPRSTAAADAETAVGQMTCSECTSEHRTCCNDEVQTPRRVACTTRAIAQPDQGDDIMWPPLGYNVLFEWSLEIRCGFSGLSFTWFNTSLRDVYGLNTASFGDVAFGLNSTSVQSSCVLELEATNLEEPERTDHHTFILHASEERMHEASTFRVFGEINLVVEMECHDVTMPVD
jgi:hypothetical protein